MQPRTQQWLSAGFALCLAAALSLPACAPPANTETLTKEVLKSDPEFSDVLAKHREISNRIATYDRELALKRSTVERSIEQLRRELTATGEAVKLKIADAKKRMEPDRKRLELELAMASEELKTKRFQRATLGRQMAQLRKALKSSPSAPLAPEDQVKQQAQLDELVQDAARLDQEMTSIQAHVRLVKVKLLLIKL